MGVASENVSGNASALKSRALEIRGESFSLVEIFNDFDYFVLTVCDLDKVCVVGTDFTCRFERIFDPLFQSLPKIPPKKNNRKLIDFFSFELT